MTAGAGGELAQPEHAARHAAAARSAARILSPSPTWFFNGLIDEATVHNVELTGSQVAQIAAAGALDKCP